MHRDIKPANILMTEEEEPLETVVQGVPDKLSLLIEKALAKDAEGRYQEMDELLADLKGIDEELGGSRPVQHVVSTTHNSPAGVRVKFLNCCSYGSISSNFSISLLSFGRSRLIIPQIMTLSTLS